MANEKSWWQKHWKSLMIVVTVTFAVFYVAVFASVWHDRNYKSDFWPNFFLVSGVIVGLAIIAGWVYGWTTQNRRR